MLHLGFVSRFISAAVQAGFMFGLGLTIIVGQLPALLGVSMGEGKFFPQLWHVHTQLGDTSGWTAILGLGSLALLLGLKRAAPGIPAALVVVAAGIVVVALGGLADHGVDVIGKVEGAAPTPVLPSAGWDDLVALLPLFRDLPQAALGAIVISAVIGFLNLPALGRIRRLRRDSFALALATLLGVLVLGVLGGLLLAVAISVLLLLVHQSRPGSSILGRLPTSDVYVALENEPAARTDPGLLVFRVNAPLLFVNAKLLRDRLQEQLRQAGTPVRIVLLDLQFTPQLDIESVNVLVALHRDEAADRGMAAGLSRLATAW